MARGKQKINARESRREAALQQIVDSMIGPYGDFVREQLQDIGKTMRSRRAAQTAPPPGAGAPGAMPMSGQLYGGGSGTPPGPGIPIAPPGTDTWPPEGAWGNIHEMRPDYSDIPGQMVQRPRFGGGQVGVNMIPDPGYAAPAPMNPYLPIYEDGSQDYTDPRFVVPPPPMYPGQHLPMDPAQIILQALRRNAAPIMPTPPNLPPGRRF